MSRFFFIFSCLFSLSAHTLDYQIKDKINKLVLMDMQGLPFEERHNSSREESCNSMSPNHFVGLATNKNMLKPIPAPKSPVHQLRLIQKITIKK